MTTRDETTMIEEVRLRLGSTSTEAEHSLCAVVDAVGEALTGDEARALAAHLPDSLSEMVRNAARRDRRGESLEEIVAGVSWRENVDANRAREVLTAVCGVLADDLPDEVTMKLRADLPPSLATLIATRPPATRMEGRVAPPRPPGSILATAQPRSSHPISEARPEIAHTHSVVRSDNPHGDSKLSSGH